MRQGFRRGGDFCLICGRVIFLLVKVPAREMEAMVVIKRNELQLSVRNFAVWLVQLLSFRRLQSDTG